MRSGFKGYPPNTRRLDQPGPRTAPPFNSFNLTGINAMRLDIELSETEIHIIRMALEEHSNRNTCTRPYMEGHVETLDGLRARFKDLASIPLPTP